jgi:hypothetical protein
MMNGFCIFAKMMKKMKRLDVVFEWQNATITLKYEIPNGVTNDQVKNAILEALQPHAGEESLGLTLNPSGFSFEASISEDTTFNQVSSAINSAITIIGGRSRRG